MTFIYWHFVYILHVKIWGTINETDMEHVSKIFVIFQFELTW